MPWAMTARSVLHACALLGRRFDWDLLRAVTGLTEGTVLACLRERLTRNCW
jgi:hypothetical protein